MATQSRNKESIEMTNNQMGIYWEDFGSFPYFDVDALYAIYVDSIG